MFKIGILSDTHAFYDPRIAEHFSACDEIWHAGDVGSREVLLSLNKIAPIVGVYGNIDGTEIRSMLPPYERREREGLDIFMTHIGGYPGNYDRRVKILLEENPPDVFIAGHSHILKIMPDKKLGFLHINPGASGRHGMHKVRTLVRLGILEGRIDHADVIELGPRSIQTPPGNAS